MESFRHKIRQDSRFPTRCPPETLHGRQPRFLIPEDPRNIAAENPPVFFYFAVALSRAKIIFLDAGTVPSLCEAGGVLPSRTPNLPLNDPSAKKQPFISNPELQILVPAQRGAGSPLPADACCRRIEAQPQPVHRQTTLCQALRRYSTVSRNSRSRRGGYSTF